MTTHPPSPPAPLSIAADPVTVPATSPRRPLALNLIRLARPHQWAKSAFVLIGPLYHLPEVTGPFAAFLWPAFVAAALFALLSSACYIVNDIMDAPQDRAHPRKRTRPIASGEVQPVPAAVFAAFLLAAATALLFLLPTPTRWWVALWALAYVLNVSAYSMFLKHAVMADVMCLSFGFVLRVMGGCAAVGIFPTSWLLNCIFFLAMFLAFGKRLGERKTMGNGEAAAAVRVVQSQYTDDLLRMVVVVTAVATLITYAGYVQAHESEYKLGINLLWLTILPATFGLFRCIVLLERGVYDDPTELAAHDRPFQAAVALFGLMTGLLVLFFRNAA